MIFTHYNGKGVIIDSCWYLLQEERSYARSINRVRDYSRCLIICICLPKARVYSRATSVA